MKFLPVLTFEAIDFSTNEDSSHSLVVVRLHVEAASVGHLGLAGRNPSFVYLLLLRSVRLPYAERETRFRVSIYFKSAGVLFERFRDQGGKAREYPITSTFFFPFFSF